MTLASGLDHQLTNAERVAIEHIAGRRSEGWSLFDCRCEVRQCAAVRGVAAESLETWDDVTDALAKIWECLPHHRHEVGVAA